MSKEKEKEKKKQIDTPTRIHQNNSLRRCQVQPDTPGLETHKQHFATRVAFERIKRFGAFFTFHGSIQAIIPDFMYK